MLEAQLPGMSKGKRHHLKPDQSALLSSLGKRWPISIACTSMLSHFYLLYNMYIPVGSLTTQNPKLKMKMLTSTILILNYARLNSFSIQEQRKVLSKTSVPTPTPHNLTKPALRILRSYYYHAYSSRHTVIICNAE